MKEDENMDGSRKDREPGAFERMGEQMGEAAGRAAGRGTDMAAGLAGSLMGAAASRLGEWWSSGDADRAARSFDDRRDRSCRDHFEADAAGTTRSYDEVRPLYQFGHMAGQSPDYQGRDFGDVEPHLQRAWEEQASESRGDWPEVRGYVGFGYSQAEGESPRDV
jgi:hypothetical protein